MNVVLLADKVDKTAVDVLEAAGMEVRNRPGLTHDELREAVREADGVICRSGVTLCDDILEGADRLKAICRAGVGVDNIDLAAASRRGVVVMNTPGANTVSTAEHTFALLLGLARNIGPAYISMREGRWDRKKFTGVELSGTTLGIVGLGRVGLAVARRALAFGMHVSGYDPFISRKIASETGICLVDELDEMLPDCDYLTIHIPGSPDTRGLIGPDAIQRMKPGARLINCARGEVVDMGAVVEAVRNGRLAGAAFDVYDREPPPDFSFAGHDNILATPHLGASTEAAQIAVGVQAAEQMVNALNRHHYENALNIVAVPPDEMQRLRPFCELAMKLGTIAGSINRGRLRSINVVCKGELARSNTRPIQDYATMGILHTLIGTAVNIVNAPYLAQERGIEISSTSSLGSDRGFTTLIELELSTDRGDSCVTGTVLGQAHQRLLSIDRYDTELAPEGHLLLVFGQDKPGLIGMIGDVLGRNGINIARMTFGRRHQGGSALLVLNLDSPCDHHVIEHIENTEAVERAVLIGIDGA